MQSQAQAPNFTLGSPREAAGTRFLFCVSRRVHMSSRGRGYRVYSRVGKRIPAIALTKYLLWVAVNSASFFSLVENSGRQWQPPASEFHSVSAIHPVKWESRLPSECYLQATHPVTSSSRCSAPATVASAVETLRCVLADTTRRNEAKKRRLGGGRSA